MIYGRGKWRYGTFAMAARDAARRFAFCCGGLAGRHGWWRPLVLRWRRRPRRHRDMPGVRAATKTPVLWFPQFHFHYATYLTDRTGRERMIRSSSAVKIPQGRITFDRHWAGGHDGAPQEQPHRAYHPSRPSYAHDSLRKSEGQATTNPRSWPRLSEPSIARSARDRSQRRLFEQRPEDIRVRTPREEWNQPRLFRRPGRHSIEPSAGHGARPVLFERLPGTVRVDRPREQWRQSYPGQSRISHHWLHISRLRTPVSDNPVPDLRQRRKAVGYQFHDPEELVWRRVNRRSIEVTDLEQRQESPDSFQRPSMRTFQTQEAANVSPLVERPAPQITKLDPGLLDRLTDDVIRRVEKRARIERQRRGL